LLITGAISPAIIARASQLGIDVIEKPPEEGEVLKFIDRTSLNDSPDCDMRTGRSPEKPFGGAAAPKYRRRRRTAALKSGLHIVANCYAGHGHRAESIGIGQSRLNFHAQITDF
jgi:hypothetical protein